MSELELPASIGPFRIVRRLGAGGMAETFEGMREGPGGFAQRVCVKRVLPTYEQNEELGKLFLREARLAAELSHRAITRIVELGEDGAGHYLAMELVDGPDLRTLLRRQPSGRLPRALAVLVAVEIASALEHAHARGIAHRDVSPANVLIGRDGDVKLTDFG
ncbi:MAG: serine/threonine protein kinase, partial [Myxococcales bacterium]|nr:serine/threonine protein kinase [Myxococcales bacterium]